MSPERNNQPIGGPEPMLKSEIASLAFRAMNVVVVVVSGLVAFAFFMVPTRTSGASRSAKLQLRDRQREINQAAAQAGQPVQATVEEPSPKSN